MAKENLNLPQIDYVHKENFWKDMFRKEKRGLRDWNLRSEGVAEEYKQLYRQLANGNANKRVKLPRVVDDFPRFKPHPEPNRCYPDTTYGVLGWKDGNRVDAMQKNWFPVHYRPFMHKQIKWPEDHQW